MNWCNKQQSEWCKIPSDGVPIGSGSLAWDLGGITIWNHLSNESDANLEDSACTLHSISVVILPNFFSQLIIASLLSNQESGFTGLL